jgi:TatD DNase family protein
MSLHAKVSKNPNYLTEHVRIALSRNICKQNLADTGELFVITLSPDVEQTIAKGASPDGQSVSLDPMFTKNMLDKMNQEIPNGNYIAIGEVGLDYYWSREFEKEQLDAFEQQVQWSVETQLPLMIHCRKAQNEMVKIIRRYEKELPGGVFHCFTGNQHEATELLQFDKFVLGIGGVSTFKKSHLAEDLATVVPMDRIVLETDAPYMAPAPHRGKRNESSFIPFIIEKLALAYGTSNEEIADTTTATAKRVFRI